MVSPYVEFFRGGSTFTGGSLAFLKDFAIISTLVSFVVAMIKNKGNLGKKMFICGPVQVM